jgi:hypothetical protein
VGVDAQLRDAQTAEVVFQIYLYHSIIYVILNSSMIYIE